MNRVLTFLRHDCQHCRAARLLSRIREVVEAIEAASGGRLEFSCPTSADYVADLDKAQIKLWSAGEFAGVPVTHPDIPGEIVCALRFMAHDLEHIASDIETAFGEGVSA